jgi:hypothetical protein
VLYESVDSGVTWRLVPTTTGNETFLSVACPSSLACIASSSDPFAESRSRVPSHITWTSDGGSSWHTSSGPALVSVSCGSLLSCVGVGGQNAFASSDSGRTWTLTSSVDIEFGSVTCQTKTECWGSGAELGTGYPPYLSQTEVYDTADGANSWSLIASPQGSVGPGVIACESSNCQEVGTTHPTLDTSSDAGAIWTPSGLPAVPRTTTAVTVASDGGVVIVGGDALNGAYVVTSP